MVADIDKIYKYDNPEANLDTIPQPQVVYDDMPPYPPHGWKYLAFDKDGWLYVPFGPPCNECLPPTSTSQVRRVNPANGLAEIVALGVRNSVGGDVDPRTGEYWFSENARDWLGDDVPSDKLNHITKIGEHFGYPYCHQGDIPDPKLAMGHKCSEFSPPAIKLHAQRSDMRAKLERCRRRRNSKASPAPAVGRRRSPRPRWRADRSIAVRRQARGRRRSPSRRPV
jgi:glucose/arabinose dehydrogenase